MTIIFYKFSEMIMKKTLKNLLCSLLCVTVIFSSVSVVAFGGSDSDYPQGVTSAEALAAVDGTDRLLEYIVPALTGKSLSATLKPLIYNDEALSSLVVSLYGSLEANAGELEMIGISATPQAVASALADYEEVSVALDNADSWANVDLTGVKWGVTGKTGFATAVGKAFSPFNELLYMLLCSGTYTVSGFIKLEGDDGYTNAIVPLLRSLKCEGIISTADFKAQADSDKSSMLKNILLPVLDLLERAFKSPADTLTDALPSFAYFSQSGEMDKCMDALLSPITTNTLVEIAVFLKILDLESFNFDINTMLTQGVADMAKESGLELAPIDLAVLSACGSHNGAEFVSDRGRAYVEIMGWLVETLKLNKQKLPELIGGMGAGTSIPADALNGVFDKSTDDIVKTIILLFTPTEPGSAVALTYPSVTPTSVQYTPNLTPENYEKVLKEIDSLLDDFVKEGGSYSSVEALLCSAIYTNANITALLKGVYGALEEQGISEMLTLVGIDISPAGVAEYLTEGKYTSAVTVLSNADSWAKISESSISWGFYNGSRNGFENALVAVLRPLYPLLRVVLAGEDMTVMNSITIKGADGYNTGIIPILEALDCKTASIKTYAQYVKSADSDGLVKNITTPVFDLLDEIFNKPVNTLTRLLPNIVYFINSGSLEKCLGNLLLPVTALTDKLSGIAELELDMGSLTKLDLNSLMGTMMKDTGMQIAEFDVNTLSGLGTLKEYTSKSTINGQAVKYSYVEADQKGVLMTLLRVLARTMKMPGNENLLMGSMGGGNAAFSTYSSSIGEQFAQMTEDELIEWLYNLLFKERAQIEITVDADYNPTIIYKEPQRDYTAFYIAGGFLIVAAIICVALYCNRKRLYY